MKNSSSNYIFNLFLGLILSTLSFVVPKNKKQILLGSHRGLNFFGSPKNFFFYLNNKQNYFRPLWITRNKKLFSKIQKKKLPVLYLYSLKGFFAILRSYYLVFDHGSMDVSYSGFLMGRYNMIQTWHGTPLKNMSPDAGNYLKTSFNTTKIYEYFARIEPRSFHTVLSASDETQKVLQKIFENENVKILGYPRNDVFFDKMFLFDDYEKKFKLKNYSKIILYCPTFRDIPNPKSPFSEIFLNKLDDYLKKKNYLFLIKSHVIQKVNLDTKNFSNIIDVSDEVEDVQDLLTVTDILISDYSSIFFDFMLTEKPIIFYSYDYNEFRKIRKYFYYNYYEELPGPFAKNENQLLDYLEEFESFFADEGYKKKYNSFKKRFNYFCDGKSSDRLFNHLQKCFS